jgi:hypothetical protein
VLVVVGQSPLFLARRHVRIPILDDLQQPAAVQYSTVVVILTNQSRIHGTFSHSHVTTRCCGIRWGRALFLSIPHLITQSPRRVFSAGHGTVLYSTVHIGSEVPRFRIRRLLYCSVRFEFLPAYVYNTTVRTILYAIQCFDIMSESFLR